MSQEGIEKLVGMAMSNDDLRREIAETVTAAREVEGRLVDIGAQHQCEFTPQDAAVFLALAHEEAETSAELDDSELEAVAGGRGMGPRLLGAEINRLRRAVLDLKRPPLHIGGGGVAKW